jgi:hypothetical protein
MEITPITKISRLLIDLTESTTDFASNEKFSDVAIVKLDSSFDSKKIFDELTKLKINKQDIFENNITKKYNNILNNSYISDTLTEATKEAQDAQALIDSIRGVAWNQRNITLKKRIESMIKLNDDYDPLYDERNYTKFDKSLEHTYTYEMLNQLKSKINRTRVSTLLPNSGLSPHKDLPIKLGGRIHIPIKTNKYCLYYTCVGNTIKSINMEEGSVYFINSGVEHWMHNFSNENRIHLIICCSAFLDSGEILW